MLLIDENLFPLLTEEMIMSALRFILQDNPDMWERMRANTRFTMRPTERQGFWVIVSEPLNPGWDSNDDRNSSEDQRVPLRRTRRAAPKTKAKARPLNRVRQRLNSRLERHHWEEKLGIVQAFYSITAIA
jgi:hypothetical protein